MKKCFKCNITKPLSEFYKHSQMKDGHLNKCKECAKIDVKQNREANVEYYRDYERARSHLPHRVGLRNPKLNGTIGLYCVIPEGHEARIERPSASNWRKRNPKKAAAHGKLNYAVKVGVLEREPCEVCGDSKTEAHHDDYSKPLDVRWLCNKHHTQLHETKKV